MALAVLAMAGGVSLLNDRSGSAQAQAAAAAPAALPVSVSVVVPRETVPWDEFSGRLEAVERVEIRSRVAGAIQEIHFREGALVKQGDLLILIDPSLYAAEVARAEGQVAAAKARLVLTKSDFERGQQLSDSRTISQRDFDGRVNAYSEAEANLKAAEATLQTARLNLGYTEVRAPVAGRVGKLENHRGQSDRRRTRRAGADDAGVDQSDLCQLQCRRAGGDTRAEDARRRIDAFGNRTHPGADGHGHVRGHALQGTYAVDR